MLNTEDLGAKIRKKIGLIIKDDCLDGLLYLDGEKLSSATRLVADILEKL